MKSFNYLLLLPLIFLCGCAAVPTVRISGVDRDTVVDALCETAWHHGWQDRSSRSSMRVRPSDFSKRTTVSKRGSWMTGNPIGFMSMYYIHRFTVKGEKSGSTLVSVKREIKGPFFALNPVGWISPFYRRHTYLEERFILGLLQELEGATCQWVGEWRPPEKDGEDHTALGLAAESGNVGLVERLLDKGVDVNAKGFQSARPLHYAAKSGHCEIIELLIKRGATVDAKKYGGRTPLHEAAYARRVSRDLVAVETLPAAALLIEHGADVNARDSQKWTPLHNAASAGRVEVAALLIEHGADVNARENYKETPLHKAASGYRSNSKKAIQIIELLLSNGADANEKTVSGVTLLQRYPSEAIRAMLRKYGAQPKSR